MTSTQESICRDASVAVQILMGGPNDIEFVPILPRAVDDAWWADLRERWPGRNLRSIGIIGLVGDTPRLGLKDPLEPEQVDALAAAFLVYLHVMFRHGFVTAQAAADVSELHRLFALPDNRLPN